MNDKPHRRVGTVLRHEPEEYNRSNSFHVVWTRVIRRTARRVRTRSLHSDGFTVESWRWVRRWDRDVKRCRYFGGVVETPGEVTP